MSQTRTLPIQIFGNSPEPYAGKMLLEEWTQHEASARARKKVFKIVGTIFACSLIGTIVHLLLLLIVPTLFITFIAAFPVYMKWSEERVTCLEADGTCPSCKKEQKLRPYLSAQFKNPMTLQCPACGQTGKAVPLNEAEAPAPKHTAEQSL